MKKLKNWSGFLPTILVCEFLALVPALVVALTSAYRETWLVEMELCSWENGGLLGELTPQLTVAETTGLFFENFSRYWAVFGIAAIVAAIVGFLLVSRKKSKPND